MVFNGPVRSTKGTLSLLSAVIFLILLLGLWSSSPRTSDSAQRTKTGLKDTSPSQSHESSTADNATAPTSGLLGDSPLAKYTNELRNFFYQQLWKPSILPSSLNYRPFGAYNWTLTHPPVWNDPLGQDLCIIDLDSRSFNLAGQVFGPVPMTWDDAVDVHGLSLGILNHWLYAKIHGYKYYYVAVEDPPDRRSSWKKPPVLTKILREHEVCIYIDSDAIFPRLDLPFEWLLNYWQLFPDSTSLALAFDPDLETNKDRFGKLYLNTGFIIAQNNPKTYEILDAWQRCPDDDGPFPGCEKFRFNAPGQPTDQGGFGTFIRYNYSENIHELPCTEANGFPQNDWGCKGQFIRHLWTGKSDQIKVDVGEQVPGPYLQLFHQQFRDERNDFYMTEADLLKKGPKAALKGQRQAANGTTAEQPS